MYHRLDDACKTTIQQRTIDFADDLELVSFVRNQAKEPFDLNRGPLNRIQLFVRDDQKSVLLFTVHHIIFDGTSGIVLVRALFEFYRRLLEHKTILKTEDGVSYQEFVASEEEMLASARGAVSARYWRQQLDGDLPVLELPSDLPRVASASLEARTLIENVPEDIALWIRDFARTHSLRPSVIFLTIFQLLLHRYTSQDDMIVGMAVNTRVAQKFKAEIGYFVNMVPIRTHFEGRITFSDLLRRVQGIMMDALSHSSYPFPLMLEKLKLQQARNNPIFQVTYAYHDFVKEASFAPLWGQLGLNVESVRAIVQEGEQDLGVEIFEQEMSFILHLKYNPEIYTERTATRFIRHFFTLLREVCRSPERLLHEYAIVAEQERRRLLVDFNATRAEYPRDKCLHELFTEQVALHGTKTALVCGDERLTYEQLYERSQALALYLQSIGVRPDGLVGLCAEKSLDMIVGLLGILQAGGAYLPLDPAFPDSRLTHMLEDSQAQIVLTQHKLVEKLNGLTRESTRLIVLDRQWPEISAYVANLKVQGVKLQPEVNPHHLAYVMYTSGSTGRPKGVMIEHRSAVNHNVYARKQFQITPQDIQVQFYSSSADAFIEELFVILNSGAQLVLEQKEKLLSPQYLEDLINTHRITTLNIPTAFFHELIASDVDLRGIKNLIVGGEELAYLRARAFVCNRPAVNFQNTYGPTETTIISTAVEVTDSLLQEYDFVPIGAPIANTQIYILDRYGNLQPVGVPGELHIAGDGLARGYLNRPELTREKFVANPFQPGTRMYKTGDLARWLDDGSIQYLGRVDTQVKIRGFRVELGEIEAQLNRHPAIRESAIIAQGHASNKHLVAFYKLKHARTDSVPSGELREHLLRTLPQYMVPATFVSIAAIPLNPNGKVDRRVLARMDVEMESGREYVAPRTTTERQLAEIWAQVLHLTPEKIGVNDNFFELGGHSLLATQVIAKVRSQMGIDLPLKALFDYGSVAQFAELMVEAQRNHIPPIQAVDRTTFERLPLSFAQERLWFIHQLQPDSPAYNLPGIITLDGDLDINLLEQAFNFIIARHEILRTVFPSEEGQARQVVLDRLDFRLERIDLTHYDTREKRASKAEEICQADARKPFDLAHGPLLRGKAISLTSREHILMVNMHHIITDGWSVEIMIKELGLIIDALEQGRDPELAPLPIQYPDYSVWQRRWLEESGVLKQQLTYWQEKLAGVPETLDLAADYLRPSVQSFAGANHTFTIDVHLTEQFKRLGQQQGSTLFMVLLAAFKTLMYRYTGQSDICIGSPIANRQHGETEGLIGMFVNTLALRTQVEPEDTFSTFLAKVRATCLEAYEHQSAPFEKVVDMLHPQRTLAMNPIFQVMFVLQNTGPLEKLDQRIQPYPLHSGISKFDLVVDFTEVQQGLEGSIEYRTELYKPQTIERMARHFTALCYAITATPGARICDLDFINDAEKHKLMDEFNQSREELPGDKCLHELFVEQITLHGEDPAVVCGEEQLTYRQLYERSRDLALYLQSLGVKPDTLVAVFMERSLDLIVGLLGILQAGGAYVPLDPRDPDERVSYMLQDTQAAIVLTRDNLRERLGALVPAEKRLLALDQQWPEIADRVAELKATGIQLRQQVEPHHLAYLIYTSGSTGKPKGVMIEHHSPVALVHWASHVYSREELAAVIASTSICFDLSVFEIFVPLANGGKIILPRDAFGLLNLTEKERKSITLINTVPSAVEEFLRLGAIPDSVQTINLAGEPLSPALVNKVYENSSVRKVYDLYGPSETTTYSTWILRKKNAVASIGRPISNTQAYILDFHNRLQPIGVPGELHIAGVGLARGYLNRQELTREKFVANPFQPGTRMYKTGDWARWLDDGTIQYLGRVDTQVKVHGYRVELGEIEARLKQHPAIQDSAVIGWGQDSKKQLIAFYRAKSTTGNRLVELPYQELRQHVSQALPEYMVPASFVSVKSIPLTPNGKVDRRMLAQMHVEKKSSQEHVSPHDNTEGQLVEIWARVLNLKPEKIGIHDNFFELGGHSLSAVQLMGKISKSFEQLLPPAAIFIAPTIAELARMISTQKTTTVDILVPIQAGGNAPPIFGVPGAGGSVLSLQPLIKTLGPDQPFYGLQAVGLDGKALPLNSLEETAQANIAALKTLQPTGPYRFIGHSYGGVVAYEMTRILASQGEEVSSLVLLDSIAPALKQGQMDHDEAEDLVEASVTFASLYGVTLTIDLPRVRRSSSMDNIQYIAGLLNDRGVEISGEQFTVFYGVYRANLRSYAAYQPSKLSSKTDVSLYRAIQDFADPSMPRDYGWNRLLPTPVSIYDVDANHFSILKEVCFNEAPGSPPIFAASLTQPL